MKLLVIDDPDNLSLQITSLLKYHPQEVYSRKDESSNKLIRNNFLNDPKKQLKEKGD